MRYDLHLLFFLLGVGLVSKKIDWRGWFVVCLVVIAWMTFNWLKA